MRKLPLLALIAALTCSLVPADTSAAAAPTVADLVASRVARLTRLLTLTTAQATTASSLFTTEETAVATIRTSLETAHTALSNAIESGTASSIAPVATQIGTLTASEIQAEATAEAGLYAILTTDQKTKYQELLASGLDVPREGPHGGPHRH